VRTPDVIVLIFFGVVFWALGTLLYRWRGQMLFETTALRYWLNFVLTPVLSTAVCVTLFRSREIPASGWPAAALLIAIPGMIGEAVVLSNFRRWVPRLQAATAGRYGGFLFATYAVVLCVAEIVALASRG
jgi:hypothetical protein